MKKALLLVLSYAIRVVLGFYAFEACFFLMSQPSSILNAAGFLGILSIVTIFVFWVIGEIRKYFKNDLN